MITLGEEAGRIRLTMAAQPMGRDLNVSLFGGDAPHIGAVALAEPRPSLKGDGGASASCSVLAVCGHKEDELARRVALDLARRLKVRVCVACGIHLEAITPEEIATVLALADKLTDALAERLEHS